MKKLIIFTGIILGIIFFIQCDKTTEIKDYPNDNLESRTESALTNADINNSLVNNEGSSMIIGDNDMDCHSQGLYGADCITVPAYSIEVDINPDSVGIPASVVGDCKAEAIFDLLLCYNMEHTKLLSVEFDNFLLHINENSDCDNLRLWLDNLEQSDPETYSEVMKSLSSYVAATGVDNFMKNMLISNEIDYVVETKTYLVMCYECIRSVKLIPIYDKTEEGIGDIIGYIEKSVYDFVECGQGCCIDYINYSFNKEGELQKSKYTYSVGNCEQLSSNLNNRINVDVNYRDGGDPGAKCVQRCD